MAGVGREWPARLVLSGHIQSPIPGYASTADIWELTPGPFFPSGNRIRLWNRGHSQGQAYCTSLLSHQAATEVDLVIHALFLWMLKALTEVDGMASFKTQRAVYCVDCCSVCGHFE